MDNKIKWLVEKLKENAKVSSFENPILLISEQTFIEVLHWFEVKVPFHVVEYAQKYIFWMPVAIIRKEEWDKNPALQKKLPFGTMLVADSSKFNNRENGKDIKTIGESIFDTPIHNWDSEVRWEESMIHWSDAIPVQESSDLQASDSVSSSDGTGSTDN